MSWDMKAVNMRLKKAALDKLKGALEEVCEEVIMATPLGNPTLWNNPKPRKRPYVPGDLRAGWKSSLNEPDYSVTGKNKGRRWKRALLENKQVIAHINLRTKSFCMVNALPYARKIEYMGHSSKQAPQGMLRLNTTSQKWRSAMSRRM